MYIKKSSVLTMPNVHKDTHFDSAVSNIDSSSSSQKANVGGESLSSVVSCAPCVSVLGGEKPLAPVGITVLGPRYSSSCSVSSQR